MNSETKDRYRAKLLGLTLRELRINDKNEEETIKKLFIQERKRQEKDRPNTLGLCYNEFNHNFIHGLKEYIIKFFHENKINSVDELTFKITNIQEQLDNFAKTNKYNNKISNMDIKLKTYNAYGDDSDYLFMHE